VVLSDIHSVGYAFINFIDVSLPLPHDSFDCANMLQANAIIAFARARAGQRW
jgi:hypothetical protein